MSDIRVSVQWKNPTVFAGEDIECTITFKNIALAHRVQPSPSPTPHTPSHGLHRERWRETLPMRSANAPTCVKHKKSPSLSRLSQSYAATHKQSLSIGSANGLVRSPVTELPDGITEAASSGYNKHRRSVSIVSIRGEADDEATRHGQLLNSGFPGHSHTRATSLHFMPRRGGLLSNGSSPSISHSADSATC